MVYCPKCGKKFTGNPDTCDYCGEILKEEVNFQRVLKIFDGIGIIALVITLIIIYFFMNYINSITAIALFLFLVLISLIFLSTSVRRRFQWFVIKISFGGLKSKQCPDCENLVSDDNYCLNCGYPLKNVRGYWLERSQFVELNQNYVRVFKTYRRPRDFTLYRYPPSKYELENIINPEIIWCSHILFTNPCFKFEYEGKQVDIPINQEILNMLKDMFPTITGPEKIKGPITWIKNQHKIRLTVVVLITLFVVVYGSLYFTGYFTPKTELTLLSATSNITGVEFVNVTGLSYGLKNVVVEGYVKNNGITDIKFLWINCTGYDAAGNVVASDETYLAISKDNSDGINYLKPGQTGYFKSMLMILTRGL